MRLRLLIFALLLPLAMMLRAGAGAEPAAEEYFESRVRPLLAQHCYECHGAETAEDHGDLYLDSRAGLQRGGSRGPLVKPGDVGNSLLLQAVRYEHDEIQMPPEGQLPAAAIAALEQWVRLGAVVPDYADGPPPQERVDLAAGRRFWSFQPLRAEQPELDNAAARQAQRPLDAFVIRRLSEAGLSLSAAADRHTLLRRATFDLTGLPPTPESAAAFLSDTSADAYERLIDRLLASPHYGERWGRFWLDLARYSDSTASWLKSTGQAWIYRDWVVRAFNRSLPYDEFVRRQLAADLQDGLPPTELAGLGFLGLSPTYWKELRLAPAVIEGVVAEEWDERIDAVSRTFLGLTVSCARCHDHKFDPITMEDYYALAGVFASAQLDDGPLLPEPEASVVRAAREQSAALQAKLDKLKDKDSPEAAALRKQMDELRQSTPHFDEPWAHLMKEASIYVLPDGDELTRLEYRDDQPRDLPVFLRGNPQRPGPAPVARRFLTVLSDEAPEPFADGSGRRELAESMLQQSRPLAARVIVNRIWAEHFGQGIVRTTSNFGAQGERPTHPELLDHLASELIRHGWDLKWLHREIMLSAAYRQAVTSDAATQRADPENRLLWRMNRRRLTVEMWRDAMLLAAGNLDLRLGGPAASLEDDQHHRRTLYGLIARRELNRMLRLYDFPEPTSHSPRREPTTTPLQQLYVLNSGFVQRQAALLAARLPPEAPAAVRIRQCYRRLLAREPTDRELQLGLRFVEGDAAQSQTRWVDYVHLLLGLNEFLFVD